MGIQNIAHIYQIVTYGGICCLIRCPICTFIWINTNRINWRNLQFNISVSGSWFRRPNCWLWPV